MRWPARTIWDTRIQCVCGVLTARSEAGVEVYMSANFGQVSLSPPRVAINPNRLYPIEAAIRTAGRFAINVMTTADKDLTIRAMNIRRREPQKAEVLGLNVCEDLHGIPFLKGAMRTVFCEVERICETGDHTLMIARLLESRVNPARVAERALLYPEVLDATRSLPAVRRIFRRVAAATGALDLLKRVLYSRHPPASPDIAQTTYQNGGQSESEIAEISKYGLLDQSRLLKPPPTPHILSSRIGLCVVGTGSWGSFHCELIRRAVPSVQLYICGRNPERTQRLARAMKADDFFLSLEKAVEDARVQGFTLVLPHDLHRPAAERVAAAGKHAMVEKPIATTLSDADAMIEAATRAGTILMVAEDMHFRPALREAVRCISLGYIGEPLYMLANAGGIRRPQGWAADKNRMGGGVLMDIGVHYVRGLRLLLGEPDQVIATKAMQVNTKMTGEDSVQLLFSSSAGWQAHMLLSWSSTRGHLPDIVVVGDKGTIHLWPGTAHLDYYPAASPDGSAILKRLLARLLPSKLLRSEARPQPILVAGSDHTGYESEMREFVAAISEQRQPASSAYDARRDLEIVLCGYEALASGERIPITGYKVPTPSPRMSH